MVRLSDNPILSGLWDMLPATKPFPAHERERWMKALAVNLDMVYGPADEKEAKPPLSRPVDGRDHEVA